MIFEDKKDKIYKRKLSGLEASRMIGTSRTKLYKFLREKGIFCKSTERNLPYEKYMKMGWFFVREDMVQNSGFEAVCPTTMFTTLGYKNVKQLVLELEPELIHEFNDENYWILLKRKVVSKLLAIGVDLTPKNLEEVLRKKSIVFEDFKTNKQTLYFYKEDERIEVLSFNPSKYKIYG